MPHPAPPHLGGLAAAPPGPPAALPPLPPLGPWQRAYASPALRRVVPPGVALGVKRAKADLDWARHRPVRDGARAAMAFLLGATARAGDVEAIARRHVAYIAEHSELFWYPDLGRRLPVENADALRAFVRDGGGLIHFMHHGPVPHLAAAMLRETGEKPWSPVADWFFEPEAGLQAHKHRACLTAIMRGSEVFPADGAALTIPRLLAEGKVVPIASDLPGRLRTTFLGRRVGVHPGTVRFAIKSGRPILCASFRRRTHRLPAIVVHPPLDPRAFASPAELQTAIFALHEPAVLAWPEALESPFERWRLLPEDAAPQPVARP